MMCYKDATFCEFDDCAHWDDCDRAFTEEEREKATKWWGNEEAPVCFFVSHPDCYKKSSK
jgi:hypothetical protein